MARISALDLTGEQVEGIEADFGPVDEWGEARSKAALLVRILAFLLRVPLRVRPTSFIYRPQADRPGFHSVTVPHEVALHVARDDYDAAGRATG